MIKKYKEKARKEKEKNMWPEGLQPETKGSPRS